MAGPVRQPVNVKNLEDYISNTVPEIKLPLEVKQFGYGQSNPTYQLIDASGNKYVMRKKPPGKLLSATAHKVDREYRIIHALEHTEVPVPKAYCLCQDPTVLDTDFYIMAFLDGRIFEDPALPGVSPEHRRLMWQDAVRTLAKFHRVDPSSVNLSTYGKPSAFFDRQLKTFAAISKAQASARDKDTGAPVGDIPHYQDMVSFFANPSTQPRDRSSLVHGDYKIDNMVFHKTEPRVIGVLDWEMSTIGHPLSDLANLLNPWTAAASQHARTIGRSSASFQPRSTPGLPTKADCLAWYADAAGWDPAPDMAWGDAFGVFRGAVIMQGIAARYALRQASSARAAEYADMLKPWSELGYQLVLHASKKQGAAKL